LKAKKRVKATGRQPAATATSVPALRRASARLRCGAAGIARVTDSSWEEGAVAVIAGRD